jgi:DNA-directed RNA polymerase subunit L
MRLLFLCQRDWDDLWLRNLGLEDEHCRRIADGIQAEELQVTELPAELTSALMESILPGEDAAKAKEASLEFINEEKTAFQVMRLSLSDNPAITEAGYKAIFPLIDKMKIQGLEWVSVYDDAWNAKIRLVIKMNSQLGRWEYMKNGTFVNRWSCYQFLCKINDAGNCEGTQLDSLYFTLRQYPEIISTSPSKRAGSVVVINGQPPCKKMRLEQYYMNGGR